MCVLARLHQRRAPVVGYHPRTNRYSTDGYQSRCACYWSYLAAARQTSLTQSWVAPGTDEEVGLTTLSFGNAIYPQSALIYRHSKSKMQDQKDSQVNCAGWMKSSSNRFSLEALLFREEQHFIKVAEKTLSGAAS